MPLRSHTSRRFAFTVIELLVCISIIALLIALLLPSIGNAKQMGYSADCQAKLHSFGRAMEMYCQDSKGKLPWAWSHAEDLARFNDTTDPWHGYGGYTWAMLLWPYMNQDLAAYKCKGYNSATHPKEPETGILNGKRYLIFANYRPNPYFGGHGYGWGVAPNGAGPMNIDPTTSPNLNKQRDLANKVAAFDAHRTWNPYVPSPAAGNIHFRNFLGDDDRTNQNNYDPYWMRPQLGTWHMRASNVGFLDGHVELLPADSEKTFLDFKDKFWALVP